MKVMDDRGSALIIVLLMVVIFTVIGTALLTSTLSGAKQVQYRESDTQALTYAEMGVDHVQAHIEGALEEYKDEDGNIDLLTLAGFDPGSFIGDEFDFGEIFADLFKDIIDEEFDLDGEYTSNEYSYAVSGFNVDFSDDNNQIDGVIEFESEGAVDGITTKLRSTISVSAGGIFEVLSYAVGAEGDVFLHGASTIKGNLYTGGDLFLANEAHVFSGRDYYIPSLYACLDSEQSRVMGDIMRIDNISNYQRHISTQSGGGSYANINEKSLDNYFSCASPSVTRVDADFSSINVTGAQSRFEIDTPNQSPALNRGNCIRSVWGGCAEYASTPLNTNYNQQLIKPTFSHGSITPYLNRTHNIGGLHLTRTAQIRDGADLTFGWEDSEDNFHGGLYVDGNLYIGDPNTSSNANNVNNYEDIRIKGPVYVNGNLIIRGADAQFDSSLYVAGETEIRNSRLRGIQQLDDEESSLVLFGEGSVSISNISSFENNRSRISRVRGFFYSNDSLEMYGVGSNIEIEGGLFARSIVLNAIRGDSHSTVTSGYYNPGSTNWYFEPRANQENLSEDDSRLRVIHNSNLIENPPDALPQAENITIRLTEREIIH